MAAPGPASEPIAAVIMTDELLRRPPTKPDYLREKLAIQELAQQMVDRPTEVIPRLVALAMEICDGISAGVSVLDPATDRFRWVGVQGALAAMQGVTVPRENSPAGVCMDIGGPVLMQQPGRAFGWIQGGALPVSELLLVPLQSKGAPPIGALWVIARETRHFDSGHARSLSDLAGFAAIALRMIQSEERLSQALTVQETLATEMSHRVKNAFALTESLVRLSARSAASKEDLAAKLLGRLHALADAHALVRRRFGQLPWEQADFHEILARILLPHDEGRSVIGDRRFRWAKGRPTMLPCSSMSSRPMPPNMDLSALSTAPSRSNGRPMRSTCDCCGGKRAAPSSGRPNGRAMA
jgi:hypothetical protein